VSASCSSKSRSRGASSFLNARALGTDGAVYDLALGMTQTCSCPAFRFKRGDAQFKHLAWLKTKVLGVPASHYLAYQRAYTLLERLYLLERVDKHGALAPLTVREALGVDVLSGETSS
jgi:hypothetical protein